MNTQPLIRHLKKLFNKGEEVFIIRQSLTIVLTYGQITNQQNKEKSHLFHYRKIILFSSNKEITPALLQYLSHR
jgi:hypothetical protein